jgi:hypothetical protein
MCTVTFIPANGKYYFASLRDENPERQRAIIPEQIYTAGKCSFIAPVDPLGGGTWAGVNELGNVIILLNGGFKNHTKKNDYVKSRGSIVTYLLKVEAPLNDWYLMELDNIEPFTLIVWANEKLFQLIWDGDQKYQFELSKEETHIWSSSTLYDERAKKIRLKLFADWISTKPSVSKLSLLNFFKNYDDIWNGFLINRNKKIKTLSYTFIDISAREVATVSYFDFTADTHHSIKTALQSKKESAISSTI